MQSWVLHWVAGSLEMYTGGSLIAMATTRMQQSTFVHFYNYSIIYTEVSMRGGYISGEKPEKAIPEQKRQLTIGAPN